MKQKTALVAGGSGFIGSHLCDYLIAHNYKVICVDDLITGSKSNISHLLKNKNFKFMRKDVTKPFKVKGKINEVYNLASPASPIDFGRLAEEILLVNSAGTLNLLKIAKKNRAKFLEASTSEVYGEPLVHPQVEEYRGNVSTTGPRACYDESKRFAESLVTTCRNKYRADTKIVRIFNSILADQLVVLFNDSDLHIESIGRYVDRIEKNHGEIRHKITVPCFDPDSCKMALKEATAVIKHGYNRDAFELSLAYGRKVKVTGDHSVFKRDKDGRPVATPVRKIKNGDYIAIPARLPVIIKPITSFNILGYLLSNLPNHELWEYSVHSKSLKGFISINKQQIFGILRSSGRIKAKNINNGLFCAYNKYKKQSFLPLFILKNLKIPAAISPKDARIRVYKGGAHIYIPSEISVDSDLLWLMGFYLAEGSSNYKKNKSYFISFSSDKKYLEKASRILDSKFKAHVIKRAAKSNKSPSIYIHSKLLYLIFKDIFRIAREDKNISIRIPSWIFQLPLPKVKYFLEGYKDGDGTHSGKKLGNELCFDTKFEEFANDLLMLLLRFGIVASLGRYRTRYRKKYGTRYFEFYRVTVCKLSNFNILKWNRGIKQTLLAHRTKDLVWAWVKNIKEIRPTKYVYDFSVPDTENFVAGNGIFCHNTYGPRMRANDGRVLPNFINQSLHNKPLTIYGKGSQTRSFCYVSDLVEGIYRIMQSKQPGPINLGNPNEMKIIDVAKLVIKLTHSKSKIIFVPLPKDDPTRRRPDITKAKKLLKWKPKILFRKGLQKTISYFSKVA